MKISPNQIKSFGVCLKTKGSRWTKKYLKKNTLHFLSLDWQNILCNTHRNTVQTAFLYTIHQQPSTLFSSKRGQSNELVRVPPIRTHDSPRIRSSPAPQMVVSVEIKYQTKKGFTACSPPSPSSVCPLPFLGWWGCSVSKQQHWAVLIFNFTVHGSHPSMWGPLPDKNPAFIFNGIVQDWLLKTIHAQNRPPLSDWPCCSWLAQEMCRY